MYMAWGKVFQVHFQLKYFVALKVWKEHHVTLTHPDTLVLCTYLLKQNRIIVPDEIHESYCS